MRNFVLATCLCLAPSGGGALGAPSLDGLWQSDGYGFVLEIAGSSARLYSTGTGVCVPETDTMVPMADLLPGVTLDPSDDGQSLTLRLALEPHRIGARRVRALPVDCAAAPPADAVSVLDALVGYFDANYPFFPLHPVDWPTRVEEARQRVAAGMSDRALFAALSWLMAPIRDGHVALVAEVDGAVMISAPGRARIVRHVRQTALETGADPSAAMRAFRQAVWTGGIRDGILQGRGYMAGNDRVQYGMVAEETGYLALLAMDGFGPEDAAPEESLGATQTLLDGILAFFEARGVRTLILDLSLNSGGSDHIAREIAGRFVRDTALAYSKRAEDAADPAVTRLFIAPSPRRRFAGEVVVLTSEVTVSAAEVLTLALRNQPHVTHAGETTRGALSDAVTRSLPNGWQLSLPNERYLDADGRHWEAVGIPPDIEIPVFEDAAPVGSHRRAIRQLLGQDG